MKRLQLLAAVALLAVAIGGSRPAFAQCSEGELLAATCDGLTYEGCCDGGLVKWCDNVAANGPVCGIDCAGQGAVCAYVLDAGFFACRDTYTPPPEGVAESCCTPACDGKGCGEDDGCGGKCSGPDAACDVGKVCAPDGVCCEPQCADKACGPDGCGGSCGDCDCGEACVAGACKFVMCDDRDCGPDGCTNDPNACGTCPEGQVCGGDFTCCTPTCDGKTCGDNGCGGSCGFCACGEACVAGACVAEHCTLGEITLECGKDACGTDCGTCADADAICTDGACCVPACDGKVCGSDGCGGYCGVCAAGSYCLAGACSATGDVAGCTPTLGPVDPETGEPSVVPGCNGCGCEACVFELDDYCQTTAWDSVCVGECQNECGQACPCVPDCTDKACGDDGCGGTCGDCTGEKEVCSVGACCVPSCEGKQCGDDGCGGSCGTCFGENPVCNLDTGMCTAAACGPFNGVGCCDGNVLRICGGNEVFAVDCTADDPTSVCGWYAGDDWYAAGYYCGPATDEEGNTLIDPAGDPSGDNPLVCAACTPSCLGKMCGSGDGCGGVCGCPSGTKCVEGYCETCTPMCYGKGCGDDGCGGTCGACTDPAVCYNDQCCTAQCTGKECGDDGCGGVCGACEGDAVCTDGQCCTPACDGVTCGNDDGCGGTCGCASGECVDGSCVDPCQGITYEGCCDGSIVKWCEGGEIAQVDCATDPQSPGPSCGWAADAGYYWCGDTTAEDPSGTFPYVCEGGCVTDPASCNGKGCDELNNCGQPCGCAAGQTCEAGQCVACTPSCVGVVCGDDGCGGTCGTCAEGLACTQYGQCADACGGVVYEGCCDNNVVKYCENGELKTIDCAGNETGSCGWNAEGGFYDCGTDGAGDPAGVFTIDCPAPVCLVNCMGKVCGDDGCGGTCGSCAAGQTCNAAGECEGVCAGSCAGKVCGDDGCGVPCGTCDAGETCTAGQCVPDCVADCAGKVCGDDGCGGSCGTCPTGETCNAGACEKGPDTDVVDDTDTTTTDTVTNDDTDGNGGDSGGGGGCSVVGGATPGAGILLFGLLSIVAAFRRRFFN